jgi:hypothetical protein
MAGATMLKSVATEMTVKTNYVQMRKDSLSLRHIFPTANVNSM